MNQVQAQIQMLNADFVKKIISGNLMADYIRGTFSRERFAEEDDYLSSYKEELKNLIYSLALEDLDAWFYFNPELENASHDIWYLYNPGSGLHERVNEVDLSYYDDSAGKDWFFRARDEGQPIWSNPSPSMLEEFKDTTWISYSCPVFLDNLFIGVGGHDFAFDDLKKKLEDLSVFSTGYTFLMNDEHELLIHPDIDSSIDMDEYRGGQFKWLNEELDKRETGLIEYTWMDGEAKVLAFSHLSNGWVAGMTAQRGIIYQPLFGQLRVMVLMVLIGVLACYALLISLLAGLTRDLEGLSFYVQKIGEGHYDVPIPDYLIRNNTEIGILAETLEQMRVIQQTSFERIRLYNEELESLVAERTEKLAQNKVDLEHSYRDQKALQEKLVQSRKFEAINRLLKELADRMSLPLGNAGMSISFFRKKMEEVYEQSPGRSLTETEFDHISDIISLASGDIVKSVNIINQLQDITRILDVNPSASIDLYKTLYEISSQFKGEQPVEQAPEFTIDCPGELRLTTKPSLFHALLLNLFRYSVNYSLNGVKDPRIRLKAGSRGGVVFLEFHDNSKLSFSELEDTVFEPFTFTNERDNPGGMEMFIVYSLIESGLGGDIDCFEDSSGRPYFLISFRENPTVSGGAV